MSKILDRVCSRPARLPHGVAGQGARVVAQTSAPRSGRGLALSAWGIGGVAPDVAAKRRNCPLLVSSGESFPMECQPSNSINMPLRSQGRGKLSRCWCTNAEPLSKVSPLLFEKQVFGSLVFEIKSEAFNLGCEN